MNIYTFVGVLMKQTYTTNRVDNKQPFFHVNTDILQHQLYLLTTLWTKIILLAAKSVVM